MATIRSNANRDISKPPDLEIGVGVTGDVTDSKDEVSLRLETETESKSGKAYVSTATVAGACALYMFCSISMILVNKSLASR